MEASLLERLTVGEPGCCSDGWGYAQQIFNPIFTDGLSCVPSLLFGLGPNCGRVIGGNCDLLQKDLCTHCFIQWL